MALATPDDLIKRWRALTADEIEKAETLIEDASNALTVYAYDRGIDLEDMFEELPEREALATAIVCDVVRREMTSDGDAPAMSQISQSGGGYSVSGTYLTPGGGLFIKNNELKMLGLMRQKVKAVSIDG